MKAKEYAAQYEASPTKETLVTIMQAFLTETRELIEARHCRKDAATVAVFEEQARKWAAFSRLIGGIVIEDGYRVMIERTMPDVAWGWRATNSQQRIRVAVTGERRR